MTTIRTDGPAKLVLWDVDLTLVDIRGFAESWYRAALAEVTGAELRTVPETAGKTELAITTQVLREHGIAVTEQTVDAMFTALASTVADGRDALARHGNALPGAGAALAAVGEATDLVQTLVTGNLPLIAYYKLGAFGLHRYVDFEIGGFGAESERRHDLVHSSVRAARAKYAARFEPGAVAVVGDTPHDIAGALEFGAVPVGVATGRSGTDELRAAGARSVLANLTDTDALLAALRE